MAGDCKQQRLRSKDAFGKVGLDTNTNAILLAASPELFRSLGGQCPGVQMVQCKLKHKIFFGSWLRPVIVNSTLILVNQILDVPSN